MTLLLTFMNLIISVSSGLRAEINRRQSVAHAGSQRQFQSDRVVSANPAPKNKASSLPLRIHRPTVIPPFTEELVPLLRLYQNISE